MQHKPYIVDLSFMETQKSHDSINEGPLLTTEGSPQTNVAYDGTNVTFRTEFRSDFELYTPYPCHPGYLVAWHSYTNLHTFVYSVPREETENHIFEVFVNLLNHAIASGTNYISK